MSLAKLLLRTHMTISSKKRNGWFRSCSNLVHPTIFRQPRRTPPAIVAFCSGGFFNRARFHGSPQRAHDLHRHDGCLELPSRVVGLHRVLEVVQVVLSRLGVSLRHPRVLQQLKGKGSGVYGQDISSTRFKQPVGFCSVSLLSLAVWVAYLNLFIGEVVDCFRPER